MFPHPSFVDLRQADRNKYLTVGVFASGCSGLSTRIVILSYKAEGLVADVIVGVLGV